MDVTLNILSSLSWQILSEYKISLPASAMPSFTALLDAIYDRFPALLKPQYRVYWRYAPRDFLSVKNFCSYGTFETLGVDTDVYLLVTDGDVCLQEEVYKMLKEWDMVERIEEKERKRSKYDIRWMLGQEEKEVEEEEIEDSHLSLMNDLTYRKVLNYVVGKKGNDRQYYTSDEAMRYNIINCARKGLKIGNRGWPRNRTVLTPVPDVVIERKIKKVDKGKGKEKDKKDKKKGKEKKKK